MKNLSPYRFIIGYFYLFRIVCFYLNAAWPSVASVLQFFDIVYVNCLFSAIDMLLLQLFAVKSM